MKKTIAVLCVFLSLFLCSCRFDINVPERETATRREYITDVNGNVVPVFDNVERSALQADKFIVTESGRIVYDDPYYTTVTGIDVSVFQEDIDWQAVAADGIEFVMIRVGGRGYGDGELYEDARFEDNYYGARSAGLKIGVYFFSQATSIEEAVEEARYTVSIIGDRSLDMPIAFDWERVRDPAARTALTTGEQITSFARAYCDAVRELTDSEPVIYFNRDHGYYKYELSLISDYKFWYAEFADYPSFVYDYIMWQYTESGTVAGIRGKVDINIIVKPIGAG